MLAVASLMDKKGKARSRARSAALRTGRHSVSFLLENAIPSSAEQRSLLRVRSGDVRRGGGAEELGAREGRGHQARGCAPPPTVGCSLTLRGPRALCGGLHSLLPCGRPPITPLPSIRPSVRLPGHTRRQLPGCVLCCVHDPRVPAVRDEGHHQGGLPGPEACAPSPRRRSLAPGCSGAERCAES